MAAVHFVAGLVFASVVIAAARGHEPGSSESGHEHETLGRVYPAPVRLRTADADEAQGSLPALPDGVTALKFRELFELPVGDRGLEFSDQLRALAGQRVRLLGFMVHEDEPVSGRLLLSPFPLTLRSEEYGPCDDLPATVVFVHLATAGDAPVPFTPGLLLLTGTIEMGNVPEADGRISAVRLRLDPPAPASATEPAANVAAEN